MPFLDVSDIVTDPDFVSLGLLCIRSAVTTGLDGIAVTVPTQTKFAGVVTNDKGDVLERLAAASRTKGNITIHTRFPLRESGKGIAADQVIWLGTTYTVASVSDWSPYGRGFTAASCDILPLRD